MSNEYIEKEVKKIVEDKSFEFPLNLAMASAWILGNLKGINLKIFNVKDKSSLSDFFILASATNPVQARAMADEISVQLKKYGHQSRSKEGIGDSDWILLDFGDIIVHIFQENSRDFYNLDELWMDSESVEIPESYYFSSETPETQVSSDSEKDYF